MTSIQEMGRRAKEVSVTLRNITTMQKNQALQAIAEDLLRFQGEILAANDQDLAKARENGMSPAMQDRLRLTEERVQAMAQGALQVAKLDDPVGRVLDGKTLPNGLRMQKVAVPMGVVGMIYEARPNVTVDAACLCLKSGNCCLLRGGKEAMNSNQALARVMRAALERTGLSPDCIQLVEDASRQSAQEMMRLNGLLDVLIPRGGAGLIRSVVENATVPVIETGTGNCHVYVDASADLQMAVDIIVNAKTSRPSVCNAAETLLVHKDVAERFLPMAQKALAEKHVELRGCERTMEILQQGVTPATQEDYATEFLDYILAVRVVDDLQEAIQHINTYSTGHSECIVTNDYQSSECFTQQVDCAAVYVNASTRFTDGGEFGFGAEIGISTQKLHARGPMGLQELTTTKYILLGQGQIR